jgi:hypothetical protein
VHRRLVVVGGAAEGRAPGPARLARPAGLVDLATAGTLGGADESGGVCETPELADAGLGARDLEAADGLPVDAGVRSPS